jgi:hypothetical protein
VSLKLFLKRNFSNLNNFIFTNFIANKKQYYENLKLAINWNRVNRLFKLKYFSRVKLKLNIDNFKHDIALSDIFTGEEEFQPNQLENLMEIALLKNKPKFVKLLLENGLNIKKFLTVRRLIFLYNSLKLRQSSKKAPFFQLFLNKKKYFFKKSIALITFNGLRRFLKENLFEDFQPDFINNFDPDWTRTISFLVSKNLYFLRCDKKWNKEINF